MFKHTLISKTGSRLSMKSFSNFPLLLIAGLLFGLWGCGDPMDGGTANQNTTAHNYSDPSRSSVPDSYDESDDNQFNNNSEIRDIWQNPDVVMRMLGNLNGKVVADIGAGPYGYFTLRIANKTNVEKIIAIDIDQDAINFIENAKILLKEPIRNRIETRLVPPSSPRLVDQEVDVVIIVNTYFYIQDHKNYLETLRKGIKPGGQLVIVDFKKRYTPVGPPINYRIGLGSVEQDLMAAGYQRIESDDKTLDYQYIVKAYID